MRINKKAFVLNLKILFIILLVLILIFSFRFWRTGGFLDLNIPIPESSIIDTTWKGMPVHIETPYRGSLVSGSAVGSICGDNDGDVSFSSNYNIGTDFSLSSSLSGADACQGNYIKAKVLFPKGKLRMECSTSASAVDERSVASCKVGDYFSSSSFACSPRVGNCNDGHQSKTESFVVILEEPEEILIELTTRNSRDGGASANLRLIFEEEVEGEIPTLTFFDRINSLIQSAIDWIMGLFK